MKTLKGINMDPPRGLNLISMGHICDHEEGKKKICNWFYTIGLPVTQAPHGISAFGKFEPGTPVFTKNGRIGNAFASK